ncbi:MAG: TetR family transcriptional regulator [Verrucomicrobiaceae bacterium]|nr:TetR family transcriptional regulator [Verrucomicrobiaceae bacterium]
MTQAPTIKRRRSEKEGLQRILLAARGEFCRAGLAGAKLDVIALEAEVSKQLIHHYFRAKEELYVAVMDDASASAIEELSNLDYENHEPAAAMRLFLHGVFDLFIRWPFLAGLLNGQSLYGGEHIPECRELIERSPALMKRLVKILEAGQRSGIFKNDVEPDAIFGAAMMVTIGCFTNGKILSSLVTLDLSSQENTKFWREFSVKFVLDALRP